MRLFGYFAEYVPCKYFTLKVVYFHYVLHRQSIFLAFGYAFRDFLSLNKYMRNKYIFFLYIISICTLFIETKNEMKCKNNFPEYHWKLASKLQIGFMQWWRTRGCCPAFFIGLERNVGNTSRKYKHVHTIHTCYICFVILSNVSTRTYTHARQYIRFSSRNNCHFDWNDFM